MEKNLSLRQLGEIIGYDSSNLSKVERGEYRTSSELLAKLADVFGVSVSYFYGEKIETPAELEGLGIEEIRIMKEIRSSQFTDSEIKQIKNFIDFLKSQKENVE
jgi:transcriptional regulator with XRE-family HTH domain